MCKCRFCKLINTSNYGLGPAAVDKMITEMFLAMIMRNYGATECLRTRYRLSKLRWTERTA